MARRFGELPTLIALLQDVDPAPESLRSMALAYVNMIFALDLIGQLAAGNALTDQFSEFLGKVGQGNLQAAFWGKTIVGIRAAHAYQDPWLAFQCAEVLEGIVGSIGGEANAKGIQLMRGLSYWFLGALAAAADTLAGIAAADETLGMASSVRRFALAWVRADEGALDEARALATELSESSRAHHDPLGESRGRWALAEVLHRQGDLDGAERELEVALAMVPPIDQPGVRGSLAALRLAQGRTADALAAAEGALARDTAMGGAACCAARSFASPVPRRSTRPAIATPRAVPSPTRGRACSRWPTRSQNRPTGRASSSRSPRTRGPWRSRAHGSASRPRARSAGACDLARRSARDQLRPQPPNATVDPTSGLE